MNSLTPLTEAVINLVDEGQLEKAYELCFSELTLNPASEEVTPCLAILSLMVGNHELADWYLSKSKEQLTDFKLPLYTLIKHSNNIEYQKKWDNYRRPRNEDELKRMAVTAPLCVGKVLEIGCANGDLSTFIAAHGASHYGIDIDPVAIDLARYKAARLGIDSCHFQLGDGHALNFPENCFDTVVLAEVLEHVDNPKQIVKEAYSVCKPGGRVIISVPNGYAIPDPDHVNIFSKNNLAKLVENEVNGSLQWIDTVPNQWLLAVMHKPQNDGMITVPHSEEINSLFLPPLYSVSVSDKLVSIIMTTYNRTDYIIEAIESILSQTHKNIEIIVVDDGSDVPARQTLAPYKDKITYLYKENGGKSSALNAAIQYVNGDYIWVFDDDDIALPLKLELQLKQFELNPKLGMVHTRAINFDDQTGAVNLVYDLSSYQGELDYKQLLKGNFVHGPTVLFKKDCLNEAKGWDEELVRAQDYDFWLKLAHKFEIAYLPVPTVRYRVHRKLRGSSEVPVHYNDLTQVAVNYEQLIFKKIYRTIPIDKMYPDAFDSDNVTLMLEALIERVVVFGRRQLIDEVKLDLKIIRDSIVQYGNPCFSATAINHIHEICKIVVDSKWQDDQLLNNLKELAGLIMYRD